MDVTLQDIKKARDLLKGVIVETPTLYSPQLSRRFNAPIYLKLENFQETGSFKERGAYVKINSLSKAQLEKGIIAVSAGNHAQAVAFHAHKLGIPSTIVMPVATPSTKVANTERWGARIVLEGNTLEKAARAASQIEQKEGLTFIHPFEDPKVIAGQGTIGLEMLESHPEIDTFLVPIGGGGLSAGIALAVKGLKPEAKIYGVEVEGYASMAEAIYNRTVGYIGKVTLADGIAVKKPGKLNQAILKDLLEDIIVVSEGEVEEAVDIFARHQYTVVEGAGAVGLSALLHQPSLCAGRSIGIVVSGGNIDARLMSAIMMRGQIREGRLCLLRIEIPDVPGVLASVSEIISRNQANILEVKHQRLFYEIPIKMAKLEILVETRGEAHSHEIIVELETAGFSVSEFPGSLNIYGLSG